VPVRALVCVCLALGVTDFDSDSVSELYDLSCRNEIQPKHTHKTHNSPKQKKFAYKQKSQEESKPEPDPWRVENPNRNPKSTDMNKKKVEKENKTP